MPGPAASGWTFAVYGAQHSLTLVLRNNLNQISLWRILSISVITGGHFEDDPMFFLRRLQIFSTLHFLNSSDWLKSGACSNRGSAVCSSPTPNSCVWKTSRFSCRMRLKEHVALGSAGGLRMERQERSHFLMIVFGLCIQLLLKSNQNLGSSGFYIYFYFLFKRICVGAFYLQLKRDLNLFIIDSLNTYSLRMHNMSGVSEALWV